MGTRGLTPLVGSNLYKYTKMSWFKSKKQLSENVFVLEKPKPVFKHEVLLTKEIKELLTTLDTSGKPAYSPALEKLDLQHSKNHLYHHKPNDGAIYFTEQEVNAFCTKHNLEFGLCKEFQGELPEKAIKEIDAYVKKYEDTLSEYNFRICAPKDLMAEYKDPVILQPVAMPGWDGRGNRYFIYRLVTCWGPEYFHVNNIPLPDSLS